MDKPTQSAPTVPVRTRVQQSPNPAPHASPVALRATILHPMVSGQQRDDSGRRLARNIITRFECHGPQGLLFAMDLQPALSANPGVEFWLQAESSQRLRLRWTGDHGFEHEQWFDLQVR